MPVISYPVRYEVLLLLVVLMFFLRSLKVLLLFFIDRGTVKCYFNSTWFHLLTKYSFRIEYNFV